MLTQKNAWRRTAAPLAALVLSGAALTTVTASPAAAATCSGSLIETKNIKNGDTIYAKLKVYYNSSTKKNCALVTNEIGGSRYMMAAIARCSEGTGSGPGDICSVEAWNSDSDYYEYYAGPVYTIPAAGHCILAEGYIRVGSFEKSVFIDGHCG